MPGLFNYKKLFLSFSVYLLTCLIVYFKFWASILCMSSVIFRAQLNLFIFFWLSFHSATEIFIEPLFWVHCHEIQYWSCYDFHLHSPGWQNCKDITSIHNKVWKWAYEQRTVVTQRRKLLTQSAGWPTVPLCLVLKDTGTSVLKLRTVPRKLRWLITIST